MRKYRKKPVVIEAMRFSAYTEGLAPYTGLPEGGEIFKWMHENGQRCEMAQTDPGPAHMLIPTLEGVMRADIGDWIIRGVQGEFYPVRGDIFQATYDEVEA